MQTTVIVVYAIAKNTSGATSSPNLHRYGMVTNPAALARLISAIHQRSWPMSSPWTPPKTALIAALIREVTFSTRRCRTALST